VFDISFSELIVIAVVALLVIGPEKLPKLARTLGAYTGRMQRFVTQVKDEVNREMRFEELQKLQQEVNSAALQTESSIMAGVQSLQDTTMDDGVAPVSKPATKRKASPKIKKSQPAAGDDALSTPKVKRARVSKKPAQPE
jgi:sec-independent protein translocase protein TatB